MSSGPKAPKSTTQTVDLPAWAQPYAKDVLAKGAALTDISQNPYQRYGGERVAGFDPMQQQSFQGAANMQVAPQIAEATRLAMESGNYNPADFQNQFQTQSQTFNPEAAQQYMSPYMQAALEPQLRSAARDAQLAQMADQAKQVGQGAFGGSRTAIGQGMREQGLMQNLGDIRAKGYQTAFEQAANQFQQDQARRVQEAQLRAQYGLSADQAREQSRQFGAQTGLQAAGQLGALGGQQFQQGMDINKLQNLYGQQKQAQAQRPLDIAYQDFADQRNYPYKQLGFMSDLVRGMPLGQTSTTSMYGGSGDPLTTVAGLGAVGKGAGLFKKGGAVKNKKASGLGVLAMHKIAKG